MGLEIEQSQRILTIDMKALAGPSELQELEFVKWKTALLKRINRFRRLQGTYMPELAHFLTVAQQEIWDDKTRGPEATRLFMPSELGETVRRQACEKGLADIEEEMREGELQETLEDLCQVLCTRTMTNRLRHRNMTGQRALTRGQGGLRQITICIHKAKLRYRYAHNALLRLRKHGVWEKTYHVLEEADVRGMNERTAGEEEEAQWEKLRELGEIVEGGLQWQERWQQGRARTQCPGYGISRTRQVKGSWWKAPLMRQIALRVKWCEAYARTTRWHEDIVLVDEQMRWTIEFGVFMQGVWEEHAEARTTEMSPALAEGLHAYASQHVECEQKTCMKLVLQWSGLWEKVRRYLADKAEEEGEQVVVDLDGGEASNNEGDVEGDERVDGEAEEDNKDNANNV